MSFLNPDALFRQLLPYFLSRDEFSQIAQTTLTGSVASVTFSSIPQTFRSLQLITQARTDRATEADGMAIRFNADSGNNYDRNGLFSQGAAANALVNRAASSIVNAGCEAANSRASNFSPAFTHIFGYSQTDREKWLITQSAQFGDVSADNDLFTFLISGRWRSTNAITSITILPAVGLNFVSGSIFQLYGLQ